MKAHKFAAFAVSIVALAGAGTAAANPVTYDFTSGFITLTVSVGGVNELSGATNIPLTGTQVTFDAASPASLTSFQFADSGSSTITLAGTGPLNGEMVTVQGLNVVPDATYSSTASGSNPYSFTAGKIDATGMYTWMGPVNGSAAMFTGVSNSINGQITLGGTDSLQLTGITLDSFMYNGSVVTLKADVVFVGMAPVPLPPAVLLLASGLGLLALTFMKRRCNPGAYRAAGISLATLAIALLGCFVARPVSADTVNVTGGQGLDQGALCLVGQFCPGIPAYSLVGADPVTGSFVFIPGAPGTGTVNFTLTLTANASFGGEAFLKGSTFSATGIAVTEVADTGGGETITQTPTAATGLVNASFAPGLAMILNTPSISGLSCTIGTGADQCGVSFGSGGFEVGPDGAGKDYNAFVTFNTNVTPVPLPAAAWLMLSGLGYFATLKRKRRLKLA
ncbi:MAG TPA: VPLPA-CTERM sorting domain-containing protein [Steroidobacteraceae bacterium]|jgi:hypothetical protein